MNKLLVLKDIAYADNGAAGTISGYNEIDELSDGALAFLNDQGILITAGNLADTTPDSKYFTAVVGRLEGNLVVPIIPRQAVKGINVQNYRASTKPIITISPLSVLDASVGDISVTVKDITESSKNFTRSVRGSVYKKASTSASAAVDELVSKLNAGSSFITASKTTDGVAEQFTIQVTSAATVAGNASVDIDGVTVNLPLTIASIAVNTAEITAVIDALPGWTATDDGVDTVTAVAVATGVKVDVANYLAGGATSSAATLVTTVQGVAATYLGITVTPKEDDVVIGVSLGGLIESDSFSTTTAFIHSRGKGADILQMEKDFSAEEGNGNYVDYTDLWYKRVMQTVLGTNYDVVTFNWEGTHSSPTRTHNVMKNNVCIACVDAAGVGQGFAAIMTLLAGIVATAYSATVGEEPALDDGTETDGVAGN